MGIQRASCCAAGELRQLLTISVSFLFDLEARLADASWYSISRPDTKLNGRESPSLPLMYTYIFRGSIGVAFKIDPTTGFEFNVSFPISALRRRPLDLSSEIPFSRRSRKIEGKQRENRT